MTRPTHFILNNEERLSDLPAGLPVLDYLRHHAGVLSAKDGCHQGDCGACSVLLGELNSSRAVTYRAVNACLLPLGALAGRHLLTLEGLNGPRLTLVQQAMLVEGASQCGFCTPGMVIALCGFLLNSVALDEASAIEALDGNLCRCTGYGSLKRAAGRLLESLPNPLPPPPERLPALIRAQILPQWLGSLPARLRGLPGPPAPLVHAPLNHLVAGATDALLHNPDDLVEHAPLFLPHDSARSGIELGDSRCRIGAATRVEELLKSPALAQRLPQLHRYLAHFASTPVRTLATLGGNLVNASPIGDLSVMLLALDAVLELSDCEHQRRLPLREFYLGYRHTRMHPDELLEAVSFPLADDGVWFNFEKVAHRGHLDVAAVNSACHVVQMGGRLIRAEISAGGVGPKPLYLERASAYLAGKPATAEHLLVATGLAQTQAAPIDDIRGSAAYKRLLLRQLIFAHFLALFPRCIDPGELLELSA